MKRFLLFILLLHTLESQAQSFSLVPSHGQVQKITADSVLVNRLINATIRGASTNFSISFVNGLAQLHTVQATAVNASQGNFTQTLSANSLVAGSIATNSFQVNSVEGAIPIFGITGGQFARESPELQMSINAAGFTPERISPLENANLPKINGQVRSFSEGEAEMYSINNIPYRLVAPLPFALNADHGNILIQSMKICVFDQDNSLDLVAVLHEVNDSQNSSVLVTTARMAVRSLESLNRYRCFEDEKSLFGEPFSVNQSENSYFISVFAIPKTIDTLDIFKGTPSPVTLDNPGLRLVHVTLRYIHH